MTLSKDSNNSALASATTVALAALAGSLSYFATREVVKMREQKEREISLREERGARELQAKKQQMRGLPSGTKVPFLQIRDIYLWEVEHLGARFESEGKGIMNKMHGVKSSTPIPKGDSFLRKSISIDSFGLSGEIKDEEGEHTAYNELIGIHECILADTLRKPNDNQTSCAYVRAGPRREIHFKPKNVNAAIVTCGGLCPGLNNVIREIVNTLIHLYDIGGKIYGVRGGYKGFYSQETPPIELTPTLVQDIHRQGGTYLGSSRGGFDIEKIMSFIEKKKINQLYVIGGDGTHRGAFLVHEACMAKGLNVAVAGIPKTIDNDIDYIDRSFGFATAVEAAQAAINSAKVEASCNLPNGIGLVKLMGRSSGFIAVHATMGSGDVDLVLVPEVPIVLHGKDGCLPHLWRRVQEKGHAVVVLAEGAGEEILGESTEKDASGNKKLPKIGDFMKEEIEKYFKSKQSEASVKYIDPSYMIRSVPANASDGLYCMQLAQNAVHGK